MREEAADNIATAINRLSRVLYLAADCIVSNQARAMRGEAPAFTEFSDVSLAYELCLPPPMLEGKARGEKP
jgi:hypothetical protein